MASRGILTPSTVTARATAISSLLRQTLRAHDLIAAPSQIPDRCAQNMHKPGEGEDKEDRQAENEMRLEDRRHIRNISRRARPQRHDMLRPVHELHHLLAVEMLGRNRNGGQAEQKLR